MSKGITLSPKHGVNPTIPICFWCGKEKNEIALMGLVKERDPQTGAVRGSDVKMPMHVILDYEPCDCCKEQFSKGVQLIECSYSRPDERPALSKDENYREVYPTGRTVVLTEEAAQRIFKIDKSMLEAGKKLCLPEEVFNQFMPTDNI